MCRALKVLCAAPDAERLAGLKRATVSVHWELVGGAVSAEDLAHQVVLHHPDVVVVDAALGTAAVDVLRGSAPLVRVVAVGPLGGADAVASSMQGIRDAILGIPRPGGPVGR
jgi:hypothetical protein